MMSKVPTATAADHEPDPLHCGDPLQHDEMAAPVVDRRKEELRALRIEQEDDRSPGAHRRRISPQHHALQFSQSPIPPTYAAHREILVAYVHLMQVRPLHSALPRQDTEPQPSIPNAPFFQRLFEEIIEHSSHIRRLRGS